MHFKKNIHLKPQSSFLEVDKREEERGTEGEKERGREEEIERRKKGRERE